MVPRIRLNGCHNSILYLAFALVCLSLQVLGVHVSEELKQSEQIKTEPNQQYCTSPDQDCMSGSRVASRVMRAIRVSQFGGPEVLKVQTDVAVPKPQAKQVLIQVSAAGVNPVDTYIRNGTYAIKPALPYTPGSVTAGVVQETGPGVTKFKKGDRVFTIRTLTGGYAEQTLAEEDFMAHMADSLSFEQGACLGVPYFTAYRALMLRAKAKPGETVLIHGASGGVGVASTQIGKWLGLRILGTAGSPEGVEFVKKNGADFAFNHREEGYTDKIMDATGGEGPDIIVEMLANVNLGKDLEMIKKGGRIVNVGSRGTVEVNPRFTMAKECTITGVMLMASAESDWKEMYAALGRGMEQGWVKPHVGKVFPLDQASQAHDHIIKTKGAQGQIVLKL